MSTYKLMPPSPDLIYADEITTATIILFHGEYVERNNPHSWLDWHGYLYGGLDRIMPQEITDYLEEWVYDDSPPPNSAQWKVLRNPGIWVYLSQIEARNFEELNTRVADLERTLTSPGMGLIQSNFEYLVELFEKAVPFNYKIS